MKKIITALLISSSLSGTALASNIKLDEEAIKDAQYAILTQTSYELGDIIADEVYNEKEAKTIKNGVVIGYNKAVSKCNIEIMDAASKIAFNGHILDDDLIRSSVHLCSGAYVLKYMTDHGNEAFSRMVTE